MGGTRAALVPRRRLRSDRRAGRQAEVPDQRAELRPLQNLRHQRPQPEHRLDRAAGRRRAELFEYVTISSFLAGELMSIRSADRLCH